MNKYEAMIIVKPTLSEEEKKTVFSSINDTITKFNGTVSNSGPWAERKKMCFSIKKFHEGTYYLVNFTSPADSIANIRQAYRLNENILRTMFSVIEE
jgi:small subunit ribosomal protein S6